MEAGKNAVDVTHLFLSHLHYDHCADYVRLMLNRWDQAGGVIPDLKLYGPNGTQHFSDRLFDEDGAFHLDIRARTELEVSLGYYQARGGTLPRPRPQPEIRELAAHDVVETDNWRLTCTNVPHAQPVLTCFAYRIDTDEGSMVYSGRRVTVEDVDHSRQGLRCAHPYVSTNFRHGIERASANLIVGPSRSRTNRQGRECQDLCYQPCHRPNGRGRHAGAFTA